jgi:hypothetical protein
MSEQSLTTLPIAAEEHPVDATPIEARQGTGPRDMVVVLTVSLLLAAAAGTLPLALFLS